MSKTTSDTTDTSKIDPNTGNTALDGSSESQVDIAARVQDGLGKASDHKKDKDRDVKSRTDSE